MARIRTIKPEFCTSEKLADVSRDARLLFILLWPFCDDGGVHPDRPRTIKMQCFPGDEVSAEVVDGWLAELARVGVIYRYVVDGERLLHVVGWKEHQKIERPTKKWPGPAEATDRPRLEVVAGGSEKVSGEGGVAPSGGENSTRDRRGIGEGSASARRGLTPGREGKGKEEKQASRVQAREVGIAFVEAFGGDPSALEVAGETWQAVAGWLSAGYSAEELVEVARRRADGLRSARRLWGLAARLVPDEVVQLRSERAVSVAESPEDVRWRAALIGWRDGGRWPVSLGPAPDGDGCIAPRRLRDEVLGKGRAA